MLVEVCANSLESAINAQKAGANRIELCVELGVGGITPSYGLLKAVKKEISIPVNVLIRPRSGDFTYSDKEFGIMKDDVELCVDLGLNGVVSGLLNENYSVDTERTSQLIALSQNLDFTFHRAFDWVENPIEELKKLENIGVNTILSSGQQKSAFEGMSILKKLNEESKCVIMPGGGVNVKNALFFKENGFDWIHLSGTKFVKTLSNNPKVSMNSMSFINDDKLAFTDKNVIADLIKSVK